MKNQRTIGGITVGGQPSADELAGNRYAAVVNVRLADEQGNDTARHLTGSETAYAPVPFTGGTVTTADIERIRDAVEAADGPVLIH